MKARKDNKVYDIQENQKKTYLAEGYDIYDDKGKVVEYSPLKKIDFSKYMELKKKLAKLESEKPETNVVEELNKKIAELEKNNSELVSTNENLVKEKEELTKNNSELIKEVEKLTKEIEKTKK